jgi:hypothetical protein
VPEARSKAAIGQKAKERGAVNLLRTQFCHYRTYSHVALFVVFGIVLIRGNDGVPVGIGHEVEWKYDPWLLDTKNLKATKFDHTLPW